MSETQDGLTRVQLEQAVVEATTRCSKRDQRVFWQSAVMDLPSGSLLKLLKLARETKAAKKK